MQITIEYMAQIKKAAGKASETITVNGPATLGDVLKKVAEKADPLFASLVFVNATTISSSLLVSVNDEQVDAILEWPLNDGDRITLITPMSGG